MTEIGQFWIAFRSCSKDFGIQLSQIGRFDSKTFHRITWFYRGLYFIDHILLCFSMKIEIQKCIFLINHSNFRYRLSIVCCIQYTSPSISKDRPQSFIIFRECSRTSGILYEALKNIIENQHSAYFVHQNFLLAKTSSSDQKLMAALHLYNYLISE